MTFRTLSHRWRAAASMASCIALVALAGLMAAPAALAQGANEPKPVAIVAASSLDDLLNDIDSIASMVGAPSVRDRMEGTLQLFTGDKKVPGLDDTRVWGIVLMTDGINFQPIVCLPVTDLDAMLTLLRNFQMTTSDIGNGITEIEAPNQSLYVKEANGWAFFAQAPESLDNAPSDPAKVLSELTGDYNIGVRARVQNIPEMYRQIALTNLRDGFEQALEQTEDETDEQFQARRATAEAQLKSVQRIFEEWDELTAGLDLKNDDEGLHLDLSVRGLPGTRTDRETGYHASGQTRFAQLLEGELASRANVAFKIGQEDLAAYQEDVKAQLDSGRAQMRDGLRQKYENPIERQVAMEAGNFVLDLFHSALHSGDVDIAATARLEPGSLTVVGAFRLDDPSKLTEGATKLAAIAQMQPDQVSVTLEAGNHQGVTLHTASFAIPADKQDLIELVGDRLEVVFGVGDQVGYMVAGRDAMKGIEDAIDGTSNSDLSETTPLEIVISLQKLMAAMAASGEMAGNPAVQEVADKLAEDQSGQHHIRISSQGIDGTRRTRVTVERGVIEALGAVRQGTPGNF